MESEVGLVAGRSQREKRRSYKDLLREEEIIDAEVRKSSKKRLKNREAQVCSSQDSQDFYTSSEIHKKKKKHDGYLYKDRSSGSLHKKQKRSSEGHRSLLSSPDLLTSPQTGVTAMGLLQAITSPMAVTTEASYPSLSPSKERRKDMRHASSSRKQPQVVREGLPVVGEEVELEGHYGGCHDFAADSSGSLSADGSSRGKLMIHETSSHSKKKKSKKIKKKKDRHPNGSAERSVHSAGHHRREEKKKRPEGGKRKSKDKKKKKVLTAYQIFYKEYRNSILEEEPGSVWRERSEYLQRKQMKSDAVKQHQTASQRHLKDSSRPKDHHVPVGGGVALKRRDAAVAPVQNGSVLPPRHPDVDPIDAAAHLQLLGESLSLIGRRLQETEGW
ncbi:HMG box-containing protein 4 High mobility group protein 2-like 1 [Triplophysa tibetana]|uniref:HMG box-containing protein 4 High mobility group protein 2-like 1 n=1 Tax=Triplophysa tibetana TaxID=1572043 RepID=A0A5A9NXN5_9TELE|nr:HMG box-containing protein 4 High mobility group protein 2-like 1 [Triplophysa tibetana]